MFRNLHCIFSVHLHILFRDMKYGCQVLNPADPPMDESKLIFSFVSLSGALSPARRLMMLRTFFVCTGVFMSSAEIDYLRLIYRAESLEGVFIGSFYAWRQIRGYL